MQKTLYLHCMTNEQELLIIQAAMEGKTGRVLALENNVSASTISNIFRRHGFKPPTGRRATCELDHEAFDVLTEASEYWMGFLCADGSIDDTSGSGSPQLMMDLALKDKGHVEKFRSFLKSTHTISERVNKTSKGYHNGKGGEAVAYRVRSVRLVDALRRHGLGGKSPTRVPDATIENSPHFWRGAVDGDGTVRWTTDRAGNTYANIMLCGHMPLMEKFQAFLLRNGLVANIIDTASGIYQIRLLGSGALRLIEILYGQATIALDRKYLVASDIITKHGKFNGS